MTGRFDIERAVKRSDLSKSGRLLMLVLLTYADATTAAIPEKYSPSLSMLSAESTLSRSTVQTTLRHLERTGWLVRQRPPVELSRKGARTRYRLTIPAGSPARSDTDLGVGLTATQGRSVTDLGVGLSPDKGRSDTDLHINQSIKDNLFNQRAGARETTNEDLHHKDKPGRAAGVLAACIALVLDELEAQTGNRYDHRDVSSQIHVMTSGARDPVAFITAVLRNGDWRQFKPKGPARLHAVT